MKVSLREVARFVFVLVVFVLLCMVLLRQCPFLSWGISGEFTTVNFLSLLFSSSFFRL